MQCISCNAEIDPRFAHAIEVNSCPYCGQVIVEPELRSLLSSLRETMENLKEYSSQLDDWLLSNYNYIKTDNPNIVNYVSKDLLKNNIGKNKSLSSEKITEKYVDDDGKIREQEVIVGKTMSDEDLNGYYKRAEIKTSTESNRIRALKKQIESGEVPKGNAAALLTANAAEENEMSQMLSQGDLFNNSNLSNDDDDIPAVVLAMSNRGSNNQGSNNKDLLALHNMVNKSKKSFVGSGK